MAAEGMAAEGTAAEVMAMGGMAAEGTAVEGTAVEDTAVEVDTATEAVVAVAQDMELHRLHLDMEHRRLRPSAQDMELQRLHLGMERRRLRPSAQDMELQRLHLDMERQRLRPSAQVMELQHLHLDMERQRLHPSAQDMELQHLHLDMERQRLRPSAQVMELQHLHLDMELRRLLPSAPDMEFPKLPQSALDTQLHKPRLSALATVEEVEATSACPRTAATRQVLSKCLPVATPLEAPTLLPLPTRLCSHMEEVTLSPALLSTPTSRPPARTLMELLRETSSPLWAVTTLSALVFPAVMSAAVVSPLLAIS